MLAAVEQVCPVENATVIDGRETAARGIIRPVSDPLLRANWPESIYLRAHHTTLAYTIESPSALPLAQRVAALRAAGRTGLVTYTTAGDPDLARSGEILKRLDRAGAADRAT